MLYIYTVFLLQPKVNSLGQTVAKKEQIAEGAQHETLMCHCDKGGGNKNGPTGPFLKWKIKRLVGARFLSSFFGKTLAAQNILHAIVALMTGILIKLTCNLRHRHDRGDPIGEGRRII